MMQTSLSFYVNGTKVVDYQPDPEWTLAYYLREKLFLKGTKVACGEGQCGSCSVMVSQLDFYLKKVKHYAVNACLVPVVAMHGCAVTTVEGIGSVQKRLHPVQERLAKGHGIQCGFCTPGFVMSMYVLLRNNSEPTKVQIQTAIEGNLCRCTGYRPILEAFYSFADKKCPCGLQGSCCKENNLEIQDSHQKENVLSSWTHLRPYDSSQDPIFPPELMTSDTSDESIQFIGPRVTWHLPNNLQSALNILKNVEGAKVVASAALTGFMERTDNSPSRHLVSIRSVVELIGYELSFDDLTLGSALSIVEMENVLNDASKRTSHKVFNLFLDAISVLGNAQIKNYVSWVGNIASGSNISDLSICCLVAKCRLNVQHAEGTRRIVLVDNLFFADKIWKVGIERGEIIKSLIIPLLTNDEESMEYFFGKQSQRHGADSAIVNAACCFVIDKKTTTTKQIRVAFGGAASRPYLITIKDAFFDLKADTEMAKRKVQHQVEIELKNVFDKSADKIEYKLQLCLSFVDKFFQAMQQKLSGQKGVEVNVSQCLKDPVEATQIIPKVLDSQPTYDSVGRPLMNVSAEKHATGESMFLDDIGPQPHECHLALVVSQRAHARILFVDYSEALAVPGVIDKVDINDIPTKGTNTPGAPAMDSTIFVSNEVESVGEAIGAILADDSITARRAVKLVKVVYEDLHAIVTKEEAIESNAFYEPTSKVTKGDVDAGLADSDHVIKGVARLGGQEHFYMEPQSCLVVPKDGDEYEVHSATQAPGFMHVHCAKAVGIAEHKIVVKVKRIGGGFGGKGEHALKALWPTMIAAYKVQRPVRLVLTRSEDMIITGKRPSFLAKYEVGFQNDATLNAIRASVYLDSGCKAEFNTTLMYQAISNMDSGYNIPNMLVEGRALKTNLITNTFMRGAGQPEGHFLMECILENVAQFLHIDTEKIRRKYLYKTGDMTLHGIRLEHCKLEKCWEECAKMSRFEMRKEEIVLFNKNNQHKKRGIAMSTVKTGIGQTDIPFEQGGVLVHIYLDGSVQISHGGIEMGQGLTTKLLQIASRILKIPIENITTIETASDKVANPMPTGGSIGTDVYGPAVQEACEVLMKRLEPFIYKYPKGNLVEWAQAAQNARVSLTATGFSRPTAPNDNGQRTAKPRYYVFGVACTEVEVDCSTGDHFIVQSDLVMDIGRNLNPALDVGQIEGAFTQGFGLVTMEELAFDTNGQLVSNCASKYKIPTVATVPRKFRVAILDDGICIGNIYSSKGVGEPPLTLGFSAYFAIIDAIKAARAEVGMQDRFQINSPATPEKIRMLCPNLIY